MQLFLSFSSNDYEVAAAVIRFFQEAGHTVRHEFDDDPANWVNALVEADVVIALFSPFYKVSRRLQVHLSIVHQYEKPLLPILVAGNEGSAIPFGFENYDYIDGREQLQTRLQQLLDLIAGQQTVITKTYRPSAPKREIPTEQVQELGQKKPIHKIFIAYSRKQRSLAKELYDLLASNGQFAFWDAKLRAGANWRQTIQRALDECTHVVVIWTPDAAHSDEVEREVSYALAKHKTIIPILSKEIPELPYHLFGLHYLILQDDLQTLEQDLIDAIEQFSSEDDLFS
jgi:hypothetical protein